MYETSHQDLNAPQTATETQSTFVSLSESKHDMLGSGPVSVFFNDMMKMTQHCAIKTGCWGSDRSENFEAPA